MPRLHICALGSSFAAGPGIPPSDPNAPRGAGRSARNYPHLLAEKLDADLTDLTVSGATLQNVLDTLQKPPLALFAPPIPPQCNGIPATADIVTITAGGNDMGYMASMLGASLRASILGPPRDADVPAFPEEGNGMQVGVQGVADRFAAVIDRVKEKAPNATVYLVDYVDIFGAATEPRVGHPLSRAQVDYYVKFGEELVRAFRMAAEARPRTVHVPVSVLSRGHEVGSEEPWVTGFSLLMMLRGGVPYHIVGEGHVAIADELYKVITARSK